MSSNPFSKLAHIPDLSAKGGNFTLEATPDQCDAVAKRLDIPAVRSLQATLHLKPIDRGVHLDGQLSATLERRCVASLEPLEEIIDETMQLTFSREANLKKDGDDFIFDHEDEELLEGDDLDLGDIVIQQLALAMEPYPRKSGAATLVDDYGKTGETSPFAVLKNLQTKPENKH